MKRYSKGTPNGQIKKNSISVRISVSIISVS